MFEPLDGLIRRQWLRPGMCLSESTRTAVCRQGLLKVWSMPWTRDPLSVISREQASPGSKE